MRSWIAAHRFLANRFLRRRSHHSHAIEQHVEWYIPWPSPSWSKAIASFSVQVSSHKWIILSPRWRLLQDACKSPLHLWHVCCCRMYAFDVHCNSYFPLFLLLYGKLFFSVIVSWCLCSNVARSKNLTCLALQWGNTWSHLCFCGRVFCQPSFPACCTEQLLATITTSAS